ncbi:MAG TPA: ABC transporter substrate-binding protein [Actinomycetota bacterium]|nr:ABC transporter substrate-binding protein [Actinomycetota bacterium]
MRSDRRFFKLAALLVGLMLIAAACGGGGDDDGGEGSGGANVDTADIPIGGKLTMAGTSDVDYMDPQATYYTLGSILHRGVSRTLVTYPAVGGEAGIEPIGDLAVDLGQSNEDATEWTYQIKDGVKWGQALGGEDVPNVTGEEITCDDIKYGIERQFIPSVGAQYAYYYEMIEGAKDFQEEKADNIEGIECVNDKEIVFHLTEPTGDWDLRLAMPATSPVPQTYAEQFDSEKDSDYDNHVVASGPYQIQEWKPEERIVLTRNEHWSRETDEARGAYAEEVEIRLGFDPNIAVKKIQDGDFTIAWDASPTEALLEQTVSDPDLSSHLAKGPSGCMRYIYMNTRLEPFDDLNVRKAVNLAIDRENIKRLQGGPVTGPIATSILPPGIPGYLSAEEFNPYETPNMAGDMEAAKQLMAEAGYENGYTDEIFVVGSSTPPHNKYFESIRKDLEELGFTNIRSKLPEFPFQYSQFYGIPAKDVHMGTSAGWCKDWNDAVTFFDPLLHGENILESGNSNYSEVADPELNQMIDDAAATADPDARATAWEEVNRYATEQAYWVPWSWDEDLLPFSPDAVNAYYHYNYSLIDWPNVGVATAETE